MRESPGDGPRHALLGLIYGGLGRCADAAAEGERARELLPESEDAFDGPILAISRARIAALCGDDATALGLLERSIGVPAGITANELRFSPGWDALRDNPRFQRLLTRGPRDQG